ncbi:HD domain-containing protein [Roseimicrobium sp. ORNL1]|uniref:HD domain-containing protein n=1 Tax=Roseimicrobium sp. ORNL1 TaxID=2711231 RepID=UPI0013E10E64|nr:HD domain-containing protein [Roseimicrobium sp. ORNL1]QIF03744.1 bifunctional (p)ppGpp synthetase/guanosine-3',5'-bis(diphosphate) 3'-pyrophosphohydrolase [Roseimicrobium sp. ORNL1]
MNDTPASLAPEDVNRARDFAVKAHGAQLYGGHPYVYHLEQAVHLLKPFGSAAQVVGFLHDVVEDTETPLDAIAEEFGDLVADCVKLLSDSPEGTREEKKERSHAKLGQVPVEHETKLALVVKAADRLANLRHCAQGVEQGDPVATRKLAMYRKEYAAFRTAVYRIGLCEDLWEEMEDILEAFAE